MSTRGAFAPPQRTPRRSVHDLVVSHRIRYPLGCLGQARPFANRSLAKSVNQVCRQRAKFKQMGRYDSSLAGDAHQHLKSKQLGRRQHDSHWMGLFVWELASPLHPNQFFQLMHQSIRPLPQLLLPAKPRPRTSPWYRTSGTPPTRRSTLFRCSACSTRCWRMQLGHRVSGGDWTLPRSLRCIGAVPFLSTIRVLL